MQGYQRGRERFDIRLATPTLALLRHAGEGGQRPGGGWLSQERATLSLKYKPRPAPVDRGIYRPCLRVMETTRNPTLSLKLSGTFLLRYAHRAFCLSLFQEPPRTAHAARPYTLIAYRL